MSRIGAGAPAAGAAVTWLDPDKPTVSVQLGSSESVSVPINEDWLVTVGQNTNSQLNINGVDAIHADLQTGRFVLEGGTDILESNGSAGILIQGVQVEGVPYETVTTDSPTVPAGETWVGGLMPDDTQPHYKINAVDGAAMSADNMASGSVWTRLTGGDSVSGWFGGFKL